jgi:hypothetical protein
MGIFGRKETLNEQLLREAGYDPENGGALDSPPVEAVDEALEPPELFPIALWAGRPAVSRSGGRRWLR